MFVSHAPSVRRAPPPPSIKPKVPTADIHATLSYEQIVQMKKLRTRANTYWTLARLAKKFDVSRQFVSKVDKTPEAKLTRVWLNQDLPNVRKKPLLTKEQLAERQERLQKWVAKHTEKEHTNWLIKEAHRRSNSETLPASFRGRLMIRRELFDRSAVLHIPNPSVVKLDLVAMHKDLAVKAQQLEKEFQKREAEAEAKAQAQQQKEQKQAEQKQQPQQQQQKGKDDKKADAQKKQQEKKK